MPTLEQATIELIENTKALLVAATNEDELIDAQNYFNNGMNTIKDLLKNPPAEPEPEVEEPASDEETMTGLDASLEEQD